MKYFILFLLFIFIIYTILLFNRIKTLLNKVKQSKSSIDVYLTQRFDLIPNLVDCVKAYSEYEKELIESTTKLRAQYGQSKSLEDGMKLNNNFNNLYMLSEKYPNIKSNENFINLQKNLSKMESQLQAARRLYNGDVTMYNTKITTFPGNFFSKIFGFKECELFEIDELKKVNIDVKM